MPMIMLPLTPHTELTIVVQHQDGSWTDWVALGFSKSSILVENKHLLMQELPLELKKAKDTIPSEGRDQFCGTIKAVHGVCMQP